MSLDMDRHIFGSYMLDWVDIQNLWYTLVCNWVLSRWSLASSCMPDSLQWHDNLSLARTAMGCMDLLDLAASLQLDSIDYMVHQWIRSHNCILDCDWELDILKKLFFMNYIFFFIYFHRFVSSFCFLLTCVRATDSRTWIATFLIQTCLL